MARIGVSSTSSSASGRADHAGRAQLAKAQARGKLVMKTTQSRRRFLATLSSAGAAGLIGAPNSSAQDGRLETTTVRLGEIPGICVAPQYVAKELLKTEGFADVQYVELGTASVYPAFACGKIDISMAFVAPFIVQLDANAKIVLLGGVHAGGFELFGTERVKA